METKTAIIIGAGPAGLTTAYELLTRTDVRPIVLEKSTYMGGISRTVDYKGNRMDIGGHRFFSKSDRVMNWWLQHMPVAADGEADIRLTFQQQSRSLSISASSRTSSAVAVAEPRVEASAILDETHRVMLVRPRKSRIYFLRQFFNYPIQLTADTLRKLGIVRTFKIGISYLRSAMFPIRRVTNLEQFFINRFGKQLYNTFFKSYTEKVWGVPCAEISAEWGEQRIKGLSIRKTIAHFLRQQFQAKNRDIAQKATETSLIEQFLYPKFGPGQMWETVAMKVREMGGEIITEFDVSGLTVKDGCVTGVSGTDCNGNNRTFEGDWFFSTMPIKDLVLSLRANVPSGVREVSDNLQYRDFITVGLLANKLKVHDEEQISQLVKDNWIYIQEPDVLAGRLQIFNNWSPHMVADTEKVWMGVEYFCYENDDLWKKPDEEMAQFAIEELAKIGIMEVQDVLDWTVVRVPKTYPAYFGAYERFHIVREYLDSFENLFLIGRNGMHKYNNQDHSMLTAMTAIDNILANRKDKENLWAVNTETEYHEEKKS